MAADGGRHEQYQGIGIVMRHVPNHPTATETAVFRLRCLASGYGFFNSLVL